MRWVILLLACPDEPEANGGKSRDGTCRPGLNNKKESHLLSISTAVYDL